MSPKTRAPARILIVDDDPLLRVIAEQFFRSRGAQTIRTADNGQAGLDLLDSGTLQPDFIMCDLNMPKIDGLQFLRLLKERDFSGSIAILSGEDRSIISLAETLAKSHQLNIVAALSKPLKPKELEKVISRLQRSTPNEIRQADPRINAQELQRAISDGSIIPHYQPKSEASKGHITGVEALARWHHEEFGAIGPSTFIPLAEETGLIKPLTQNLVRQIIQDAGHMLKLRPQLRIAINFSVDVLNDVDLPDQLALLLAEAGLSPESFIIEITESRIIDHNAVPIEVLARLRMRRFDLSIDDFGTAHSNLEHLSRFPFNELKIDRMFAGHVLADDKAKASVEASIMLAKRLGLRIVAEGIEDRETARYLIKAGVDELQGYLISPPLSIDQVLTFMLEHGKGQGIFAGDAQHGTPGNHPIAPLWGQAGNS